MNIKNLFFGVLALGMFASCSNDNLALDAPDASKVFDEEGNGYVKIAINLPSVTGTRGIGDPGNGYGEFNDGDKNEYAVENAILALFDDHGNEADEMNYTLVGAYDLSLGGWTTSTETQITTHREIVRQINAGGATGNLHAYVILNKHSFFSLDGNVLTFNPNCSDPVGYDHKPVTCNGLTAAQFAQLTLQESGRRYDANSFMMTNMPYANVPGGTINPSSQGTVVVKNFYPLNGHIYPTEAEAQAPTAKAAEINVERVLAKVETTLTAGELTTVHKGYKFKFLGWFIDNTNPNTYIGRHTMDVNNPSKPFDYLSLNNASANTWRMISAYPISSDVNSQNNDRYRTFFAFDPNYNTRADVPGHDQLITRGGQTVDTRLMKFDANGNNIGGALRASGSHYYCTENTFDVNHQSVSNTTRIIVVAQFVNDDDTPKSFYTLDREPDEMFDKDGIIAYSQARIADRASFMMWAQDYLKSDANGAKYIKISLSAPVAGVCTATMGEITAADLDNADLQNVGDKAAAVTAFNKLINATSAVDGETGHNEYLKGYHVNFFEAGISYYQALIKHFGDVETPWSSADHAGLPNDVTSIYNDNNEAMYLGRYGVVRNNWYKIDVTGIRQIGSPVVPPVPGKDPTPTTDPKDPDTSDDTVENFLKVKINITPWAIRKQTTVL